MALSDQDIEGLAYSLLLFPNSTWEYVTTDNEILANHAVSSLRCIYANKYKVKNKPFDWINQSLNSFKAYIAPHQESTQTFCQPNQSIWSSLSLESRSNQRGNKIHKYQKFIHSSGITGPKFVVGLPLSSWVGPPIRSVQSFILKYYLWKTCNKLWKKHGKIRNEP